MLTPPAGDEKPEQSGGFLFPLAGFVKHAEAPAILTNFGPNTSPL